MQGHLCRKEAVLPHARECVTPASKSALHAEGDMTPQRGKVPQPCLVSRYEGYGAPSIVRVAETGAGNDKWQVGMDDAGLKLPLCCGALAPVPTPQHISKRNASTRQATKVRIFSLFCFANNCMKEQLA